MKDYIGYPLTYILDKFNKNDIEIIYNTKNTDLSILYVTNFVQVGNKYYVTVSSFKIEV